MHVLGRTRTQCNGTRTRTRNVRRFQPPLFPTNNSMFIGSQSITWRSRIRSRHRLEDRIEYEYEYRDAEYEYAPRNQL